MIAAMSFQLAAKSMISVWDLEWFFFMVPGLEFLTLGTTIHAEAAIDFLDDGGLVVVLDDPLLRGSVVENLNNESGADGRRLGLLRGTWILHLPSSGVLLPASRGSRVQLLRLEGNWKSDVPRSCSLCYR